MIAAGFATHSSSCSRPPAALTSTPQLARGLVSVGLLDHLERVAHPAGHSEGWEAAFEVKIAALERAPLAGAKPCAGGEDDECAETRVDLVGQRIDVGPRLEVLYLSPPRLRIRHVKDGMVPLDESGLPSPSERLLQRLHRLRPVPFRDRQAPALDLLAGELRGRDTAEDGQRLVELPAKHPPGRLGARVDGEVAVDELGQRDSLRGHARDCVSPPSSSPGASVSPSRGSDRNPLSPAPTPSPDPRPPVTDGSKGRAAALARVVAARADLDLPGQRCLHYRYVARNS